MTKAERDFEADNLLHPSAPRSNGRSTSDFGALFVSILLFASSFGIASAEDEGAAPEADPIATQTADAPLDLDDPLSLLHQLTVAPESDEIPYDRHAFKHWVDADRDGCDSRQEVLIAESLIETEMDSEERCRVIRGLWFSLYDGIETDDPSDLQIDHMVPLKEAWLSTASTWTAERREAFANDLDDSDALLAVTSSTNQSKRDRDPAEWVPDEEISWCRYAASWIRVKVKWALSADEAEVTALERMLATC